MEKFNETWLPEKEDFHSHLNMVDYMHTKRVHKDFEIKKIKNIICIFTEIHHC